MRSFVTTDMHGAWKAFVQCLDRACFDRDTDRLICLGDACDGWPQVYELVEELMGIRNLVYILGNHDQWALEWAMTGRESTIWTGQGGLATIESYRQGMPDAHRRFFGGARAFFLENNRLFVHGGFDPSREPWEQDLYTLVWDRSFFSLAMARKMAGVDDPVSTYDEVYLGHSPTLNYGSTSPIHACECWLMDTGAGWSGMLSLMDIGSKEVFQSDPVPGLYPGYMGRL